MRRGREIVASRAEEDVYKALGLPYIEPEYSPMAIPRDDPPPDLAPEADSVLAAFLGKLPVPLISLPPLCVTDPWWLILVAHEVGHHLQFDLCGGWTLVGTFGFDGWSGC